jgi:iron complex transport system substrate-binding protein
LLVLGGAPAWAGPRVVSINLCTDQLLLELADPDQILGLSPYAHDAARSWAARAALRYPVLSGTAEEILVLRPDLVLAGRYTKRATRDLLKGIGMQVAEFEAAASIDDVRQQIRRMGALLGHPERAEARVGAIDAAITRARVAASASLSVLSVQRRGWVSGRDTLMTSLLDAVGLRNAGAEAGPRGRMMSLEGIVALKPDLLLVGTLSDRADDQGSALLQHPALRGLYPAEKRLTMPETLTVCGGPMIAEALDRLGQQVARHR